MAKLSFSKIKVLCHKPPSQFPGKTRMCAGLTAARNCFPACLTTGQATTQSTVQELQSELLLLSPPWSSLNSASGFHASPSGCMRVQQSIKAWVKVHEVGLRDRVRAPVCAPDILTEVLLCARHCSRAGKHQWMT